MTAVEQFFKDLVYLGYIEYPNENLLQDRLNLHLEIEKQQIMQTVLNLLHHELGHDDTARWIAERLEAGKIDLNDL